MPSSSTRQEPALPKPRPEILLTFLALAAGTSTAGLPAQEADPSRFSPEIVEEPAVREAPACWLGDNFESQVEKWIRMTEVPGQSRWRSGGRGPGCGAYDRAHWGSRPLRARQEAAYAGRVGGHWSRWRARDGPGVARHQAPLGDGEQGRAGREKQGGTTQETPDLVYVADDWEPKVQLAENLGGLVRSRGVGGDL